MPQPDQFEHYKLVQGADGSPLELGRGAMGVTYKAFDLNLQCHVALKVISASYLSDPTSAERFLREARGAAQLRHPHVASVFHLGRHQDSYFYAMEFIEGETLEARIRRDGTLDCLFAFTIADQVASALAAAEKRKLVHRDIKPANLMLAHDNDGDVMIKLIDFGLVKSAAIGGAGGLTSTGFVGTPYFASPEQLDQLPEDIRSDIYSLGVTLWYMLTGKPTFMGSVASVIAQHMNKTPPFETLTAFPASVVAVLRRMLEKDPAQRMQTPAELRAELRRCIEILRDTATTPPMEVKHVPAASSSSLGAKALSSTGREHARPQVGALLEDRYRLIQDLEPATPNRTYRAEDVGRNLPVRIKIVRLSTANFSELDADVQTVKRAAHPGFFQVAGVVRLREPWEEFFLMVLEWSEGEPLHELVRARGKMRLAEVVQVAEQLAPTVDAAHGLGLKVEMSPRDILVRFAAGTDGKALLRRPVSEWTAFATVMNPLGRVEDIESAATWVGGLTQINNAPLRQDVVQFGALVAELLGGAPGNSDPLAEFTAETKEALRLCRTSGAFLSAADFLTRLRELAVKEAASGASAQTVLQTPSATSATNAPTRQAGRSATPAGAASSSKGARAGRSSSGQTSAAGRSASGRSASGRTSAPGRSVRPAAKRSVFWPVGLGVGIAAALVAVWFYTRPPAQPSKTPGATTTGATTTAGLAAPGKSTTPAAPPPKAGEAWTNSLEMAFAPLGGVHMGATKARVRDFAAFVAATGYDAEGGMYSRQSDGFKTRMHSWKNPGFPQAPDHPVVGVSWEDANKFCEWLTAKERSEGTLNANQVYRLPTDREWDAAVGLASEEGNSPEERDRKIKGVYPWGTRFPPPPDAGNYAGEESKANVPDNWPTIPNYRDAYARTRSVSISKPNARGLFGLGGDAWEWCDDRYNSRMNWRVLRGGSWATSREEETLSSFRHKFDPSFRHDDLGFRCVLATDGSKR